MVPQDNLLWSKWTPSEVNIPPLCNSVTCVLPNLHPCKRRKSAINGSNVSTSVKSKWDGRQEQLWSWQRMHHQQRTFAQKTKRLSSDGCMTTRQRKSTQMEHQRMSSEQSGKRHRGYSCIALTLYDKVCNNELLLNIQQEDIDCIAQHRFQVSSCQCSLMVFCSSAISTGL